MSQIYGLILVIKWHKETQGNAQKSTQQTTDQDLGCSRLRMYNVCTVVLKSFLIYYLMVNFIVEYE
jgi:hypothetical protein